MLTAGFIAILFPKDDLCHVFNSEAKKQNIIIPPVGLCPQRGDDLVCGAWKHIQSQQPGDAAAAHSRRVKSADSGEDYSLLGLLFDVAR